MTEDNFDNLKAMLFSKDKKDLLMGIGIIKDNNNYLTPLQYHELYIKLSNLTLKEPHFELYYDLFKYLRMEYV